MSKVDSGQRLLGRFKAHLESNRAPTHETFLAFGSLSRLERLMPLIRAFHPEWAPDLGEALHVLRAKKWKQKREGVELGVPGPRAQWSVPFDQIPQAWQRALNKMKAARSHADRGIVTLYDRIPPSRKVIANIERTLRQLVFTAKEAGLKPALDMPCIRAFLVASKARGAKAVTRCSRLKELAILARWIDEAGHAAILDAMRRKRNQLARLASRQRKRKEDWLIQNPIEVVDCWMLAEGLLQEAASKPPGSSARLDLALDALAIALAVNIPLRIGDLHRLQLGVHLTRSFDADTWTVDLRCEKKGNDYVAELWPELTPFLDAVVLAGRSDGTLAKRLRDLHGQPVFAKHGKKLSEGWISKVWRRHIGTGEHIVRTLWHEEAEDDADTWMCLVLCGQEGGAATARYYQFRQRKRQARRRGKSLLRAAREKRLA